MGFKGLNLKEHEKFRLKGPDAQQAEFFEVSFDDEDSYNHDNKNDKSKEEVKA